MENRWSWLVQYTSECEYVICDDFYWESVLRSCSTCKCIIIKYLYVSFKIYIFLLICLLYCEANNESFAFLWSLLSVLFDYICTEIFKYMRWLHYFAIWIRTFYTLFAIGVNIILFVWMWWLMTNCRKQRKSHFKYHFNGYEVNLSISIGLMTNIYTIVVISFCLAIIQCKRPKKMQCPQIKVFSEKFLKKKKKNKKKPNRKRHSNTFSELNFEK